MYKQRSNWSRGGGSFRGGRGRGNRGGNWRGGRDFRGRNDWGGNSFRENRQGGSWTRRDTPSSPSKRLAEEEIGITEYVSKHEGFTGVIKSRYADFQVSEIGEDGRVAKLTDLKPPQPPKEADVQEDEELLLNKYNLDILPMEMWDRINLLATSETTPGKVEKVQIDATTMSKEQRTKVHDAVKKAFGTIIISSTVNDGDKKWMTFQKYQKGVRIDRRVKWIWPAPYTYFIVHKENVDTMEAAVRIAERLHLGIKPSMLGYAGTKDRRAKTSQWFSLRKVDPRKIAAACEHMRDVKLRVGNFEFRGENLALGMLKGNRFRIALRNVTSPDSLVTAACEELKEKGFLNYYGLQRFGTRLETPTHHVGLHLLQGKFKEAVDAILEEREGPMQAALRAYRERGAGAALAEWPRRGRGGAGARGGALELRLLRALADSPADLLGAIGKLARNTRLLYLHSYQSMVWNRAVSERVRRFGLAPAPGDAVRAGGAGGAGGAGDAAEELELDAFVDDEDAGESSDTDSQDGDDKMADGNKMAVDALPDLPALETSRLSKTKIPVKILTQEDIDSGSYTIFDVVMPLPGHMVEYPPNMKDFYVELLAKDGLTLEMKHRIKAYALSGAYRHIVVRPADVSYSLVRYSDPFADLLLSDWDDLQGGAGTGIVDGGEYKALLLSLSLPASCYATMALRELLKKDTSGDAQAKGNHYHLKDQNLQSKEEGSKLGTTETCAEESVKPTDKQTAQAGDVKQEPGAEESRTEESQGTKRRIEVIEESGVKKLKKEVGNE